MSNLTVELPAAPATAQGATWDPRPPEKTARGKVGGYLVRGHQRECSGSLECELQQG